MNLITIFLFAYCTWMEITTAIAGHIGEADDIRIKDVNICSSIIECPAIDEPDSIYGPLADCMKFCQCSNGVAYVHNCPRGLHFNPSLNICDYPDRAGCNGGYNSSSNSNNNGDNENNSSNNDGRISGDGNGEDGNNTNGCKIECPLVDGPVSVYGSLEDCTKFCQCSNGIAYVHNCPRGLHFNPSLNICDYPDRAGCNGGYNSSSNSNNNGDNENNSSNNDGRISGDGNGEDGNNTNGCKIECPLVDGPVSVYGSLEDCTKFCQCSNGIAYVHNCPRGLHFNPSLNICDYPDRAGCNGGSNSSSNSNNNGDNENNSSNNDGRISGDGNGEDGNNTNGCKIECPLVDGPVSVYGSLEDCTKFCECSNGVAYVHNCPRGLHFNPSLNICDFPDSAGCNGGYNNSGDSDISDEGNNNGDNGNNISNNDRRNVDENEEDVNSTSGCKIECPSVNGPDSVYGFLGDCTKFCQCSNGIAYVHSCPRGLHFNPSLNICDFPDSTGCNGGYNSSNSDISDESNNNGDNGNNSSNNDEQSDDGNWEDGDNINGCKIECPLVDGPDPVYGSLEDCTKFCQCSNGIAYVHSCPRGLHFNPSLNICDFPDAHCTQITP